MSAAALDFQAILTRSLDLVRENLLPLALLAGLLVGVPSLVFGSGWFDSAVLEPGILDSWSLGGLVLMVGQALLHAAVTVGLLRQLAGQLAQSLPELLATAWTSLGAVIGVSLVKGFAIGFCYGFFSWTWWLVFPVLLLAAGVWLAAIWLVSVPAAVDAQLGVGAALGRSQALTRGHRWTLVGYVALLWLLGAVAAKVAGFVFALFGVSSIGHAAAQMAVAAFDATVAVVTYQTLRDR